jgi:preprotein translocase subunit SecG
MHLKNALTRPRLALASLWLICSLLFLVNLHTAYAQSPAGETLNTKEAEPRNGFGNVGRNEGNSGRALL